MRTWRRGIIPTPYPAARGTNTITGIVTRGPSPNGVDPARGSGGALGSLIHGLDYRLDGHDLNVNPVSYNLIGLEPSVQYTLFHGETGALVAATGVLFSVAGQNDINAIYPNMSIYYYWAKKGAPVMR